jgi:hypothetical protein
MKNTKSQTKTTKKTKAPSATLKSGKKPATAITAKGGVNKKKKSAQPALIQLSPSEKAKKVLAKMRKAKGPGRKPVAVMLCRGLNNAMVYIPIIPRDAESGDAAKKRLKAKHAAKFYQFVE